MDKQEKIKKIVRHWLSNMELDDLEQFYIDLKTGELEDWTESDIDETLEGV
jgi:uncharacterized protein (DUF1786 family)